MQGFREFDLVNPQGMTRSAYTRKGEWKQQKMPKATKRKGTPIVTPYELNHGLILLLPLPGMSLQSLFRNLMFPCLREL